MKKKYRSVLATLTMTALCVAGATQAWALGNINTKFNNNRDNRQYHDDSKHQKIGGNASENSHNTSISNYSRTSNYSSTDTSNSHNNSRVASHDIRGSMNSNNRTDSHNVQGDMDSNNRQNSHSFEGNVTNTVIGGVQADVRAERIDVGGIKGDNNFVGHNVKGGFSLGDTGNTTVTTQGAQQ